MKQRIAPFRSDADDSQLRGMGAERLLNDKPLDLSLGNAGSTSVGPRKSSMDAGGKSRSPVSFGNAAATTQPAYSSQPPRLVVPAAVAGPSSSPSAAPPRKRFRSKDPYAIDYSDEEEDDDELTALPGNKSSAGRGQESLADFLRDSEPPVNNAPLPITSASGPKAREFMEKARNDSVKNLRQNGTHGSNGIGQNGVNGKAPYAPSVADSTFTNGTTATARPAHITAQVSSAGSVPKSNKPKMEVRAAGGKNARMNALHESNTGDLADFLRSSGPPGDDGPGATRIGQSAMENGAPAPVVGKTGSVGPKKGVKFWQRKRYTDLP